MDRRRLDADPNAADNCEVSDQRPVRCRDNVDSNRLACASVPTGMREKGGTRDPGEGRASTALVHCSRQLGSVVIRMACGRETG